MAAPHCPICRKPLQLSPELPVFPFCSERCKVVDLGKWLSGGYRIPVPADEDVESLPPPPEGDRTTR